MNSSNPCALVIGLSSHGLNIVRSLAAMNVEVYAFEDNKSLPGYRTRKAKVIDVKSIKSVDLLEELHIFRKSVASTKNIVLFPTNDTTLTLLAQHIDRISNEYLLSWASCPTSILHFLSKANIEQRCKEVGLRYPRSYIATSLEDLNCLHTRLSPPYIVKPVKPQSAFKALKLDNLTNLREALSHYSEEFPVIIQEWIEGTARELFFCAMYIKNGFPLAHCTGAKLQSHPPALGQTTAAITINDDQVFEATKRFFHGTDITGPVSLEVKKDPQGNIWVIEPTIGRTDFWLGLCTRSGLNLPHIEYLETSGILPAELKYQPTPSIWFDSERDPTGPIRYAGYFLTLTGARRLPYFSYLNFGDMPPFYLAIRATLKRALNKVVNFKSIEWRSRLNTKQRLTVKSYTSLSEVPADHLQILSDYGNSYPFFSVEWFKNLIETVGGMDDSILILCFSESAGDAVAILPLWLRVESYYGLKLRKVCGLANYYSPRFDIFIKDNGTNKKTVVEQTIEYLLSKKARWDVLEFSPLQTKVTRQIRGAKTVAFPYYATADFFHIVPADFSTYLGSRPSRLRNTISRKTNKLRHLDTPRFDITTGDLDISSEISNYHSVYTSSWKIDEPYPEFINGLVDLASRKGWLRLGTLRLGDKVIASQIWLVANQTAYIYKLAYDRRYSYLSPGTLLTARLFQHVIDEDRVEIIDFLHGNDQFKNEWMDKNFNLYGIQFPNPRTFRGVLLCLLNAASWASKEFKSACYKIFQKSGTHQD